MKLTIQSGIILILINQIKEWLLCKQKHLKKKLEEIKTVADLQKTIEYQQILTSENNKPFASLLKKALPTGFELTFENPVQQIVQGIPTNILETWVSMKNNPSDQYQRKQTGRIKVQIVGFQNPVTDWQNRDGLAQ